MSSVVPAGAYPRYPPGYEPVRTGYENTINTRALVGFPKWGFVIYRGTYEDDAVWKTCIELIKINVESALRDANQAEVLVPDLEWTIIEDRDTLDGASKDTVRQKFREWAANRSVERDGPGADGPFVAQRVPRFRYCVYIDKASLDALRGNWVGAPGSKYWSLRGEIAYIDGTRGHDDAAAGEEDPEDDEDEDEQYPPIEGNTSMDVGWRYEDARFFATSYEELHRQGMDWETWSQFYASNRPYAPRSGNPGIPLAEVDLSRTE